MLSNKIFSGRITAYVAIGCLGALSFTTAHASQTVDGSITRAEWSATHIAFDVEGDATVCEPSYQFSVSGTLSNYDDALNIIRVASRNGRPIRIGYQGSGCERTVTSIEEVSQS